MSDDLDPAAIMADHDGQPHISPAEWCSDCDAPWPCLPYRLAAEVAALRAQVEAVRALTGGPLSDAYRPYAVEIDGDVILTVGLDDLRAALGDNDA